METNNKNYYSLAKSFFNNGSMVQCNVTIVATVKVTPPLSSISIIAVDVSDVNKDMPHFSDLFTWYMSIVFQVIVAKGMCVVFDTLYHPGASWNGSLAD